VTLWQERRELPRFCETIFSRRAASVRIPPVRQLRQLVQLDVKVPNDRLGSGAQSGISIRQLLDDTLSYVIPNTYAIHLARAREVFLVILEPRIAKRPASNLAYLVLLLVQEPF